MQLPLPRPPFLQQQGIGNSLRAKTKKSFIDDDLDIDADRIKTPTDRLRDVDQLRLYAPSQLERHLLHVHESIERLNLHSTSHILFLCGGLAGARFSTEEMRDITALVLQIEPCFGMVEAYFQSMPTAARRVKGGGILGDQDDPVVIFHSKMDEYSQLLKKLQELVRLKVTVIREGYKGDASSTEAIKFDADPEANGSKARPVWLSTLINKYALDTFTTDTSKLPLSSSTSLPPLGRFCAFLSCCILQEIPATSEEILALSELVNASVRMKDLDKTYCNRKYWARRLFEFLAKLSELKTAVKDEKSLFSFAQFLNHMR